MKKNKQKKSEQIDTDATDEFFDFLTFSQIYENMQKYFYADLLRRIRGGGVTSNNRGTPLRRIIGGGIFLGTDKEKNVRSD